MQDDLISREETLTAFADYVGGGMSMNDYDALWDIVAKLPPVIPQEQTGHWIDADGDNAICGCCNRLNHLYGDYCKHCGAKMVEPQESCEKCLYTEETDGSHCYECVKGENKFEPQESEEE